MESMNINNNQDNSEYLGNVTPDICICKTCAACTACIGCIILPIIVGVYLGPALGAALGIILSQVQSAS